MTQIAKEFWNTRTKDELLSIRNEAQQCNTEFQLSRSEAELDKRFHGWRKGDVYEYYTQVFGVEPETDSTSPTPWLKKGLKEYPMYSHCGIECKKIIDKAAELLALCDTHEHVVKNIRKGVITAVEIICFG